MPRVTRVEVQENPDTSTKKPAQPPLIEAVAEPAAEETAKPVDIFPYSISSDGRVITITDRMGRVLQFKKQNALDKANVEIAVTSEPNGVALAQNSNLMQQFGHAAALVAIDGRPELPWNTVRDLKLRLQMLDDEGLYAAVLLTPMLYKGLTQEEIDSVAKKYQAAPR